LIGLSACLQGEIDVAIREGRIKDSKKILDEYLNIMGRENFYLELMDHGIEEQKKVNEELILLSREFEVPLVATNDVHYLEKEHSRAHELLLCIQTRSTLNDKNRFSFSSNQFYFKSGDEMLELFREVPEAITNTLEIAERCNVEFKFAPEANHYPQYEIPGEGVTEKQYLRSICVDGIKERYDFDPETSGLDEYQQTIIQRMDFELGVIDNSHYCSYFLVVWDFLKYARDNRIPVGPGRGSGAGSIVAYLTHITDIEPLRYNLLFERFLNPDRVSPPDFDIDFCERRRIEVIDYVRNKYGSDSVAQIGTYGTLKAKAVIKDVARVLGFEPRDGDKITKLIPGSPNTLEDAKEGNHELCNLIKSESWVNEVFVNAEPLVGLNRNMSIHAAGVIIGDQRLDNLVPLAKGSSDEIITQFSAVPCESLGLLKMDFLGLRTLTILQDAVDNIAKSRNLTLDMSKISLEDQATFELLNKGDTVAVFQLESTGMQNLCRQFGVETIEHIIALIAIYRPGPMQFIPDFVGRKMGKIPVEYDHPDMEQYLKETYGIMLYQEQIMQVVQILAGFSLGQADILRRAIGKKKIKVMEEQKSKFVKGCADFKGINEKTADEIWEKIAKFAGYGFNKSHSAAYAFLAYRTAYLKANYPVEFMAAVLSSELSDAEKISFLISECREMEIQVLTPDVNISDVSFSVDGESIRFGLGAIKGVGEAATRSIIESREQDGKFESLLSFCERIGHSINNRMIEQLIRAGAFDSFGLKRSQLVAMVESTMSAAQSNIKDKASGQGSLFDLLDETEKEETLAITIPDIPEFEESEMLQDEKRLLGFYISGHPLSVQQDKIKTYSSTNLLKAMEMENDTGIKVGGIISGLQKRISKKNGKPYAILQFEDLEGSMECMVYNKLFDKSISEDKDLSAVFAGQENAPECIRDILIEDAPLFIEALVSQRDENDNKKLVAERILPLDLVQKLYSKELHLHVYEGTTKRKDLEKIKTLCSESPGTTKVILCVTCADGEVAFVEGPGRLNVTISDPLLHEIQEILGENRYRIKADMTVPKAKQRFYVKKEDGNGNGNGNGNNNAG